MLYNSLQITKYTNFVCRIKQSFKQWMRIEIWKRLSIQAFFIISAIKMLEIRSAYTEPYGTHNTVANDAEWHETCRALKNNN